MRNTVVPPLLMLLGLSISACDQKAASPVVAAPPSTIAPPPSRGESAIHDSPTSKTPPATDARCTGPPYGDTPEHFDTFKNAIDSNPGVVGQILHIEARDAIRRACAIKFAGADRTEFHKLGITDFDIDFVSTVGLASAYMGKKAKQGMLEARRNALPPQPRVLTVGNFAIDGPSLAREHTLVSVSGYYILQHGVPMLYPDVMAVIMVRYHEGITTPASVGMVIDEASHKLRAALQFCDSNPGTAQTGCQVNITGRAQLCTLTNVFGAMREMPCLNAQDLAAPIDEIPMYLRQAQDPATAEPTEASPSASQPPSHTDRSRPQGVTSTKNIGAQAANGRPSDADRVTSYAKATTTDSKASVVTDDLSSVRAVDARAAERIASYCESTTARATSRLDAIKAGCRHEELMAWHRLVIANEFPAATPAIQQKCSQAPFPDSYVAKEACEQYELHK